MSHLYLLLTHVQNILSIRPNILSSVKFTFFQRYVDKNRLAAVQGAGDDLKTDISRGGFGRRFNQGEWQAGDPNDKFYIMQAEHMIKSANTEMAIHFVKQALEFNDKSRVRSKQFVVFK